VAQRPGIIAVHEWCGITRRVRGGAHNGLDLKGVAAFHGGLGASGALAAPGLSAENAQALGFFF